MRLNLRYCAIYNPWSHISYTNYSSTLYVFFTLYFYWFIILNKIIISTQGPGFTQGPGLTPVLTFDSLRTGIGQVTVISKNPWEVLSWLEIW